MSSVLLIGLGRLGSHVARKLWELDQQIMVVDIDEARVEAAMMYATKGQIGDSTNEDFLSSLGPNNFDVCIVAIGEDFQSSLETVSLLREMGAKKIVAHAVNDTHAKFLLRNGADDVVQPNKQIAEWIAIRYTSGYVMNFVDMDNEFSIFEMKVPRKWVGHTLAELEIRRNYNINVIALKNNDKLNMNLNGDTMFTADCTIMATGRMDDMRQFIK